MLCWVVCFFHVSGSGFPETGNQDKAEDVVRKHEDKTDCIGHHCSSDSHHLLVYLPSIWMLIAMHAGCLVLSTVVDDMRPFRYMIHTFFILTFHLTTSTQSLLQLVVYRGGRDGMCLYFGVELVYSCIAFCFTRNYSQ